MGSDRKPTVESRIAELEREVRALRDAMASVLAELRARKVLPTVPAGKRRRVKMSPQARAEQRRALLATARKKRWSDTETKKR